MMKKVTFPEYLNRKDGQCLIDLDTCPSPVANDYYRRNQNIFNKRILCNECDGTGNELFSMYKACFKCKGTGYIKKEK